jgi:predicted ATPase
MYRNGFCPTITIQNFKQFHDEVSFELKPITILVGPNGGGKSTIIEALNFFRAALMQLVHNTEDVEKLVLEDVKKLFFMDSQNYSQIASTKDQNQKIILSSTAYESFDSDPDYSEEYSPDLMLYQTIRISFKNDNERVFIDQIEFISENDGFDWEITIRPTDFKPSIKQKNLFQELSDLKDKDFNHKWSEFLNNKLRESLNYECSESESLIKSLRKKPDQSFISEVNESTISPFTVNFNSSSKDFAQPFRVVFNKIMGLKYTLVLNHISFLLIVIYYIYKDDPTFFERVDPEEFKLIFDLAYSFRNKLIYYARKYSSNYNFFSISDETRENPPSVFEKEIKSGKFKNDYYGLCKFLENPIFSYFILSKEGTPQVFRKNKKEFFDKILQEFDFADSINGPIEIPSTDQEIKKFKVQLKKNNIVFNISSLSSGGKQLIPIILLFLEYIGGNIAIKQPELHLHPKLQMKLADLFFLKGFGLLDNFSQGHILVETHSEHLIRKLQILVAQKKINHDDVSVLYIQSTEGKNISEIINLKLDEKGLFTTRWPNGFFEESSILNIQLIEEILRRTN